MELVLGLLCDEADVDGDGKLNVRGGFNDLYAPGFPAKQDRMVLVIVLEWDRGDHGRYRFTADLLAPDGTPTLTVTGHSDVDARSEAQPPARTRLVMPLENVVFPVPGPYRLRLSAKGRPIEGPALHLIRSEPLPEPADRLEGAGEGA
jgi:hypothetical protein